MARVHDETEWQFDADDLEAAARIARSLGGGIRAVPGDVRDILDRYYDTPDWRLFGANYALRIRQSGGTYESTLKQRAAAGRGPVTRREISESCDDIDRLVSSAGPIGVRLRDALGTSGRLRELVRVQTRRERFLLVSGTNPGAHLAELAIDDTQILDTTGQVIRRLQRVEIETDDPRAVSDYVRRLRERAHLRPVHGSKFETALEAAGLYPWSRFRVEHTELTADLSSAEFVQRTIRAQTERLQRHESMARIADDPEGVHQVRLAARTMRAILRLFKGALPRDAGRLRRDLGALGRALGPAREIDVELMMLADFVAEAGTDAAERLAPLRRQLHRERAAAQATLVEYLDGDAYQSTMRDLERLVSTQLLGAGTRGAIPIQELAPAVMRRAYRRITRERPPVREDDVTSDALHRLRIRTKEARYVLRAIAPMYGQPVTEAVDSLRELQRLLGTRHDMDIAADRLQRLEWEITRDPSAGVTEVLANFYDRESTSGLSGIRKAYVAATGTTRKRAMRELRRASRRKD
jgi:CHAD domain-containing protein